MTRETMPNAPQSYYWQRASLNDREPSAVKLLGPTKITRIIQVGLIVIRF